MAVQSGSDTTIIEFSKGKILIRALGCFAFVLLGIYVWHIADKQTNYPPIYAKIISVLCISFFGIGCVLLPYKLFSNLPGLIIDNYGIRFTNGGNKNPLTIEWKNVTGLETTKVKRTKILLIFINNAEEIINKEGMWKQKLMRLTLKLYGTPISISAGTFKCSFDELVEILNEKWKEQKRK